MSAPAILRVYRSANEDDPLEQGLKHLLSFRSKSSVFANEDDPLEQGLKHCNVHRLVALAFCQRG